MKFLEAENLVIAAKLDIDVIWHFLSAKSIENVGYIKLMS